MQKQPSKRRGRGKRGGHAARNAELQDIHSKIRGHRKTQDGHNLHGTSVTAIITDAAAIYNENAAIDETAATHIIPRKSLTSKLLLNVLPQRIEVEPMVARQLDKATGKMVTTTDNRMVWRSDRTLLVKTNPFKDAEASNRPAYKREGTVNVGLNRRNYRESTPNADNTDTVLGPAVDIDIE